MSLSLVSEVVQNATPCAIIEEADLMVIFMTSKKVCTAKGSLTLNKLVKDTTAQDAGTHYG